MKIMNEASKKPIVFYRELVRAKVGERATIIDPLNHPREELNNEIVYTSMVLGFDEESGRIETLNTIYVPVKKENP